jgi:hypothetical protein
MRVLCEGSQEAFKREFTVARSPSFQSDRALVANGAQRLGNAGIVDLPRSGLAPPWNVGDLGLDVQHQPERQAVDGRHQRERIGSFRERAHQDDQQRC